MNFHELIDERRDEIVGFLRELVRVPSVLSDAKEGAPFGESVAELYGRMLARARADGFDVFDADGWGGHLELPGAVSDGASPEGEGSDMTDLGGAKILGIPAHLDVVPADGAWVHGPFDADIADGRIYGRGTSDDKGPTAAVYMALKALRDSGFAPSKTVRIIIGLDEETGWSGMYKYLEAAGSPDFGFTPDGDFPAVNGEKGIVNFDIAKKLGGDGDDGVSVRSVTGGSAPNVVADSAKAIIMDDTDKGFVKLKAKLTEYRASSGYRVTGKGIGKSFEIVAHGVSAHGATPDKGLNAISVMMEFLGTLDIANDSVRTFIDFYNEHIGFDVHGAGMGVGLSDAPSGKLTFNVGKIALDRDAAIITVNVRYPVTLTSEVFYDALMPVVHRYDLGVVKGIEQTPIWLEPDDPLIETLVGVYRERTGDSVSQPAVIGGGTYARAIPHAVAFGPKYPGGPAVEHQTDEFISIDDLMEITHIYAEAIRRLAE